MQKSKPLTLRRNFSWTFAGNFIYAACQWGMLVVLAKLGSPEMVGKFTLGLAVTAPVFMFTNLQLRTVQATDAQQQYLFSDYLGLRLIATGLGLVAIAIITFVAGYDWETSLVILFVGLAKAIESISDIYYGLLQQQERMDRNAISLIFKGVFSLLLLGLGVYLSGNLIWGVVGLVTAWTVALLTYDIRSSVLMFDQIPLPRWHRKTLVKLTWLSLPLGLVMMLISLNTNIPRYFIDQYLGKRELGIFAAIAYLVVAGNMVILALGHSASPRLAKYYSAGNSSAFRTLLFKVVGIGSVIGAISIGVALVAGRQILTLAYKPEYAEYANLFVWLMAAAGIGYISTFLGYGITAAQYFRIQIPLFTTVTAISFIICLWLLPKLGLLGAAFALLISTIVQAAISFGIIVYVLHKLDKYQTTAKS
jgi:O-antigen/teichoic acid export membrane protein